MFNPAKPVNQWNRAIEVDYFTCDRPELQRTEFFGSAKEFAEWLDEFPYCKNSDVVGWTGDGATMEAVDSFRKEPMYALPEFITMYNVNDGTHEIVGVDVFHNLRRMFAKDRANYRIHRHFADNAKVYSVMSIQNGDAELSSYVWHVPFGTDEIPIS